jgi:hypothetical protein
MTIDTNSVPTQRASVDAAELEGGVKIWLNIQGETSHTTMAWRAPSWDALAETIDTTPSSEVAALLSRAEAAERERDVALAQARYIAKALEAAANQRDDALAREAVLREALTEIERSHIPSVPAACGETDDATRAQMHVGTLRRIARSALTSTAAVAAARDVALAERGRREGIEEAARECDEYAAWRREFDDGLSGYSDQAVGAAECADAIRALATPPADGGTDA